MKKNNVVYVIAFLLSLTATQTQAAMYIPSGAPQVVNAPIPPVADIAQLPLVQIHLSSVKKQGSVDDMGDFTLNDLANANLSSESEDGDTITVSATSVVNTPSIPTHSASIVPTGDFHSGSFGGAGGDVGSTQTTISVINDSGLGNGIVLMYLPGEGGINNQVSAPNPPPARATVAFGNLR